MSAVATQRGTNGDARWWLRDEGEKHKAVLGRVREIRMNQEYQRLEDLLHASLYSDTPMTSFGPDSRRRLATTSKRLSLNVIRNMVGAVASKVAAKNKPKPMFLPEEGDYDDRTRCENLEKFVSGVFYESGVYAELTDCFIDCCVYGTGLLKIYDGEDRVEVERTRPPEVVVDDGEATDGKPRNMYQEKYIDRLVAAALWPEHEAAIMTCPLSSDDGDTYLTTADVIKVTEAWHLGEKESLAGRHCICIEGADLVDEEWKGPFPFAVMRWKKAQSGYFGVGLAFELRGIQTEINKLLMDIQKGHHLIKGHWMVLQGSTLTTHLNNDLAAIVKYAGQPPVFNAPSAIAPDVYQHLWNLYAKAFEIAGISQLNATGQKPAGLDSGAAQRAYQDIQAERFLEVGQAYEEFVIEAARQVVRCAKRIGGGYTVRAISKNSVEYIDWKDIDLDRDPTIRVYPTSLLPTTPAGKIQWAEDMIKAQVIPPEDVLDIVDFPDTEAYAKRANAARRIIERNIAHMLRTGEAVVPEPFDNHQLAMRLVTQAYHEARLDGVPEEKLDLLRTYLSTTQTYLPKPAPPAPPPGAMPPPGAPPMPGPMAPSGPPMPAAA